VTGLEGPIRVDGASVSPVAFSLLRAIPSISGFSLPESETNGSPRVAKARNYIVTPGYAEALGLRIREGRSFTRQDEGGAAQPILVNQEFARQYLTRGPVAGRKYRGFLTAPEKTAEIIGVVDDVLKDGLDTRTQPEIYLLPRDESPPGTDFSVVVRTSGSPGPMVPVPRGFVRETNRDAVVEELSTLAQRISASVNQPRFATAVLTSFAGLAVLLAAIGLYGVLAYNVEQRRRELGVRAALGAARRDLLSPVVREGMGLVGAGLVMGIAGAAGMTRLMNSLLFGVTPLDPLAFGAAAAMLLLVAVVAFLRPAWRAASADPAATLRCE
jgi:putative ABC transport system permease protein